MTSTVEWPGVAAALLLVLAAAGIGWWEHLDLEQDLGIASVRAFVQLLAVGYALEFIFKTTNPLFILAVVAVMVTTAGFTSAGRARGVPRARTLALVGIGFGSFVTLGSLFVLGIFPFTAQMFIPISGMVVGNAMNVNSLVTTRIRDEISLQRGQIEAALCLGAPMSVAVKPQVRRALQAGMLPIIDSTKTVGLIQLPGAMTGMILAGASPLDAVRLQMVVMYMLIGAAAFTALAASWLCSRAFFSPYHQLLLPSATLQ